MFSLVLASLLLGVISYVGSYTGKWLGKNMPENVLCLPAIMAVSVLISLTFFALFIALGLSNAVLLAVASCASFGMSAAWFAATEKSLITNKASYALLDQAKVTLQDSRAIYTEFGVDFRDSEE